MEDKYRQLTDKELNEYKAKLPPSLVAEMSDDELEESYISAMLDTPRCESAVEPLMEDLQDNKIIGDYSVEKDSNGYKVKVQILNIIGDDEDFQDTAVRIETMIGCLVNTNIQVEYNGKILE